MGEIHLIVGPMFAGKTSEMLRLLNRHARAGKRCLVVKPRCDDRSLQASGELSRPESWVYTHDNPSAAPAREVQLLRDAQAEILEKFDVVGVDEGQFLPDLGAVCDELAQRGVTVVVAALDGDFHRKPYASVVALLGKCESVCKLRAVCAKCKIRDASFTAKIDHSNPAHTVIGGEETYQARCRTCFGSFVP